MNESICNNCSGKCLYVSGDDSGYEGWKCVSVPIYYFCRDSYASFWILLIVLLIIPFIFYIPARIKGIYYSPTLSLVIGVIQIIFNSILITTFVCTIRVELYVYILVLVVMFYFMITLLVNLLVFLSDPQKRLTGTGFQTTELYKSRRIMFARYHENYIIDNFDNYIQRVYKNPPLLKLKGYFKLNNIESTRNVYKFKDYVPYKTWKSENENNSTFHFKDGEMILVDAQNTADISPSLLQLIDRKRNMLKQVTESIKGIVMCDIPLSISIYNTKKVKIYPNNNSYYKFVNSCFGKFIYGLSFAFGWESIMENIFGLLLKKIVVHSNRKIYEDDSLPVAYLQPDPSFPLGDILEVPPLSHLPQYPAVLANLILNSQFEITMTFNPDYNEFISTNPALQATLANQYQLLNEQIRLCCSYRTDNNIGFMNLQDDFLGIKFDNPPNEQNENLDQIPPV